jgi:predicted kinase
MNESPTVTLITGIMASGKSSVADAFARRMPQAAHVRGDAFRRAIVSGQAAMTNPLNGEATAQLRLRHRIAARTADEYAAAGISAVVQDLYLGDDLLRMVAMIGHRPLNVVVLAPDLETVELRERERGKAGYGSEWTVAAFDDVLRTQTPKIGLWLDTSDLSVEETVDQLIARMPEARID